MTTLSPETCRQRRVALGWSPADFARRCGNIGKSTVRHYETRRSPAFGRWYLTRLDQVLSEGEAAQASREAVLL